MKKYRYYAAILAALGGALLAAAPVQAKSTNERLDELDQKQRVIERKLELDKEASKDKATVTAGKEGFAIKSNDGKFVLKLRGLIHADGRFFVDTPESLNQGTNTFTARRVRPIFEGTLFERFDFRIMPDFGGGNTALQDAYGDLRLWPYLKVRIGKFKEPVGLERWQPIDGISFVEFGHPTSLVPNRDLGVMIHGDAGSGLLEYGAGVFNGVADGSSGDVDTNDGKDIAGRLFVRPFSKTDFNPLKGLGIGIGASYGKQRGTATAANVPSYRTPGQQVFFRYITDAATPANTVFANGEVLRISPQLNYYWGPFGFLGEYAQSRQDVATAGTSTTLTHRAWQAAATYVLTGEKASYKGVKPKKPLNIKEGHWGALELAARYHELDADDDAFPTFASATASASRARSIAGGANWYLNDNVKLVADYEHTLFQGGAAAGANRRTEKAILTRLQFAF